MLTGKKIVVLGASSGIGLEVARQAAAHGAQVVMTARGEERLAKAAESIRGSVSTFAFDAFDPRQIVDFFSSQDKIDHLVSCIGDTANGTFLDLDEERAQQVIQRKFWTQLFIVKAARYKISMDGSITLTGGTTDQRGTFAFGFAFSIVGNKMLPTLVDGLAIELAPIRVNVVEPGLTATALHDDMDSAVRKQVYDRYKEMLLIHRIPTAAEVASTYIHVMESGLINGDRIRPDGGRALGDF